MPLTTFHLGIALGIGYPLRNKIHLPTFLIANVITDLEPAAVLILGLPFPHHGVVHTFLFSVILGLILAFIMFKLRSLNLLYKRFLINSDKELPFKSYLFSGISGTNLHVFLDSFTHGYMFPFFPLMDNYLYNEETGLIAIAIITPFSFVFSILGSYLYISKFYAVLKLNNDIKIYKIDKLIFILAYFTAIFSYLHFFNLNLFFSDLIYLIIINLLILISVLIYKRNKEIGLCTTIFVSILIIFIFSLSISAKFGFYFYNPVYLIPFVFSSALFIVFLIKVIYNNTD
jgi:MFS family permease